MAPMTMLCSCQNARDNDQEASAYEQARKVSNPQPTVLETAAPPLARADELPRMTLCAGMRVAGGAKSAGYKRASNLPVFPA